MAITLSKGNPSRYIGASTDTKPTEALNSISPGTTFYEYDTGAMFITYDGTNWVEKTDPISAPSATVSPDPMYGDPVLFSGGNGKALWENGWHYGASSRAASGFAARLIGGKQSSWNDFAQVKIPINNMKMQDFNSMSWTYWMENTEAFGVNVVIHAHDPTDYDKEIEISQLGDWSTLDKAAGFNSHELDFTADHMYYYGTAGAITGNNGTSYYSWDSYEGDTTFSTWVIDSISLAYGWHTGDAVFDDALILQIEINGVNIPLKPSLEQLALNKHYIDNDIPISSGIYTPRRIHVKPVFANYAATTDQQGIGHLVRGGYGLGAGVGGNIDLGIGYIAHLGATTAGLDVSSFGFPVNIPLNKIETLTYMEKGNDAAGSTPHISMRLDASRSGAWRHEAGTSTTSMYLVNYMAANGSTNAWRIVDPLDDTTWQLKNWHTRIATPDAGIAADASDSTFAAYAATDIGDYYVKEILFAYTGETAGDWCKIGSLVINGIEYIFDLNPAQRYQHYYIEDTDGGAISDTMFPQTPFRLISMDVHLGGVLADDELITLTKDAGKGANFDTILYSMESYNGSIVNAHSVFGEGYEFAADDEIVFGLSANTGSDNIGVDITWEVL